MSLLIWLPLISNTKNLGTKNTNITTAGTIQYNSGKIGNALTFNNTAITLKPAPLNTNTKEFSFAFWFKPTSTNSYQCLYNGRTSYGGAIAIFRTPENLWRIDINEQKFFDFGSILNEWHHYVFTNDSKNVKLYIDGELKQTLDSGEFTCETLGASIGRTSISDQLYVDNPIIGQINDYRIYDNVLSEREIKELAKGLTIHYALKGTGTNPNLAVGSRTLNNSSGNNTNYTHETINYDGEIVRRITTVNTNSYGPWCSVFTNSRAVVGKTYTWSMYIRGNSNFTFTSFGHECGGRKTVKVTPEWQYITHTWVYTESSYTGFTFYGSSGTGGYLTTVGSWIEIKNFKIEEGSVATPYIPHVDEAVYSVISANSNIEYDLTGNGYNGTRISIGQVSDSPRYNSAIDFTAKKSHLTMPIALNTVKDFSTAIWVKFDEDTLSTSSNNTSNIVALGTNDFFRYRLTNTAKGIFQYYKGGVINTTYTQEDSFIDNNWHHIVTTFKSGESAKLYIDGELKQTTATTLDSITPTGAWKLGEYSSDTETFDGKLSDFRLYATCLSDADVKELYNLSMSIDNESNLLSREINENGGSGITKNYGARTNEFIENSGESTYTVVGSPVIENGVFSVLDYQNYIDLPFFDLKDKKFSICVTVNFTADDLTKDRAAIIGQGGVDYKIMTLASDRSHPRIWYGTTGTSWTTNLIYSNVTFVANKDYVCEYIVDKTNAILKINNEIIHKAAYSGITYSIGSNVIRLGNTVDLTTWKLDGYVKDVVLKIEDKIVCRSIDAYLGSTKAKIGQKYISANQMEEF